MAQRVKADENAMSRHLRQGSNVTGPGAPRFAGKETNGKTGPIRQALGEVTLAAVNRKVLLLFSPLAFSLLTCWFFRILEQNPRQEKISKKSLVVSSEAGRTLRLSLNVCHSVPVAPKSPRPSLTL